MKNNKDILKKAEYELNVVELLIHELHNGHQGALVHLLNAYKMLVDVEEKDNVKDLLIDFENCFSKKIKKNVENISEFIETSDVTKSNNPSKSKNIFNNSYEAAYEIFRQISRRSKKSLGKLYYLIAFCPLLLFLILNLNFKKDKTHNKIKNKVYKSKMLTKSNYMLKDFSHRLKKGAVWDSPGTKYIKYGKSISINLIKPLDIKSVELSHDSNDIYVLEFIKQNKVLEKIYLGPSSDVEGGLGISLCELSNEIKEISNIRIGAIKGDGNYSVGHLDFNNYKGDKCQIE